MYGIGRKLSPEHKEKIRIASIGRKHPPRSEEWKTKQRLSKLGKKRGPHSDESKRKMREARLKDGIKPPIHKGADCHFWKGGITPINEWIRKGIAYKSWRKKVFGRDNYTCVWCGKRGSQIHADHIKPFADYPELRFELSNGRTLCIECHKKTETYGNYRKKYIRPEALS